MPRIPQDFFKQMGKQATSKEMGMAGAVGGIMGGAIGKMGGMAKQIMEALKKRKKPMPKPMPITAPKSMPTPKRNFPIMPQKPPKELQDLNKYKRWVGR
jgi:hypothetical protein